MSTAGLSRRALFGLGFAQFSAPEAPPRPSLGDLGARWAAAAGGAAMWDPVAARLRQDAGDGAVVSVFGIQSVPDGRGALRRLFGPGGRVAFATWAHGAIPQLLREAAALDPLPAGVPGPWAWGSRERLRQDLDHVADDVTFARDELVLRFAGPDEALDALAPAVPAVGAALRRGGRERLAAVLGPHLGGDGALTVPYLAVVARARVLSPPAGAPARTR